MPDNKLSLWMRFGQPLEPVLVDYERVFDGWQAGGVTGVVFGRLLFVGGDGPGAAFDPNPAIYREMEVEPPDAPDEKYPERRKQLERALLNAKDRGLDLFVFSPDAGQGPGGEGHPLADDRSLAARVARIRDVMEAYPMVDGGVLDGPELGYEITPGHRSNIFEDTPDSLRAAAGDLGFDFDEMVAARDRFEKKLHDLQPSEIDLRADGGLLGVFELFDSDVGLTAWFAFRRALLMQFYRRQQKCFEQMPRTVYRCGLASSVFYGTQRLRSTSDGRAL